MNEVKYDQPATEYHAFPALNKSSIEQILRCPLEYRLNCDMGPAEPTASMAFGTLVHSMILEPDTVESLYHVMSQPATTKAGKAEKAEALEQGKTIVSASDYERAQAMQRNVFTHKAGSFLVGRLPGKSEVSMYWDLETEDGRTRQCKARADRIAQINGKQIIIDLKTHAGSVSLPEIERTIMKYGYHRQSGWYQEGYAKCFPDIPFGGFYFVFTSTTAPYLCTVVKIDDEASAIGYGDCLRAERTLAECEESGVWPSYADEIVEVGLPPWAYRQAMEDNGIVRY